MSSIYETYHKGFVKTAPQNGIIKPKNFTYINFFRFALPVIKKANPKNILDVGSGAGTISFYLSSLGFEVTGIDISKFAIDQADRSARKMGLQEKVKFISTDFRKIAVDGQFDLIICFEVIEHLEEDRLVLKKLRELLNKNGLLILSTPLKIAPLTKLGFTKKFDKDVGHLRRYSEPEILKKMEDCGFHPVKVIKTEGIIRNSLYVFPYFRFIIKFIRGFITDITTIVDDISGRLFGYSDIIIFARKK